MATAEAVRAPEGFDVGAYAIGPGGDELVLTRVRAVPGRAASLRRLAVPVEGADPWTAEEFTVSTGSLDQLVSLACAAGPDATVLAPAEAVAAVRAALSAVLAGHATGGVRS